MSKRIPPLKPCTSYLAGHQVHWIQALNTANRPQIAARTKHGLLLAVDGERLRVVLGTRTRVLANHDPDRLRALAGELPCAVSYNEQFAILRIGAHCFSVQSAARGALGPCPVDELTCTDAESLAQRTVTHGGFTVPGHAIRTRAAAAADRP